MDTTHALLESPPDTGKTEKDDLEQFADWFLAQPVLMWMAPHLGIYDYGAIRSVVLHRTPPFQVELFLAMGAAKFPVEHRHPEVDTIEMHVSGEVLLTVNGSRVRPDEIARGINADGTSRQAFDSVRIRPTDFHGAQFDPAIQGSCFLSIQKWLHGVAPTSVGLNWEGLPSSLTHARLLHLQAKKKGSR